MCITGDMLTDRQTDRHSRHSTPSRYRSGVIIDAARIVAQRGLYVTVERPSVCPSRRSTAAAACGGFAAERSRDIDRQRTTALSSKCGQCHVDSRGMRLNTDLSVTHADKCSRIPNISRAQGASAAQEHCFSLLVRNQFRTRMHSKN